MKQEIVTDLSNTLDNQEASSRMTRATGAFCLQPMEVAWIYLADLVPRFVFGMPCGSILDGG